MSADVHRSEREPVDLPGRPGVRGEGTDITADLYCTVRLPSMMPGCSRSIRVMTGYHAAERL